MTERIGNWITTYTGKQFYPLDVRVEDIDIIDIAWALSCICRFGGHCREYYSVAQHSVHVSHNVGNRYALGGLLHDAAEAYIGDVCRPIKNMMRIGGLAYTEVEANIMRCVREKFGLNLCPGEEELNEIKRADMLLFHTEFRDLMPPSHYSLVHMEDSPLTKLESLSQYESYDEFMYRFYQLKVRGF